MNLPDIESAQEEATQILADLARDMVRGQPSRHMAIEVRTQEGPVLEASFIWSVQRNLWGRLSWWPLLLFAS